MLLINSTLIDAEISRGDIDVVKIPAGEISDKLDSPKSANMVMLGAFIKKSNLVSISTVIEELKNTLKKKEKLIAINEKALMAGYNLV